jgi:hypothetical protein
MRWAGGRGRSLGNSSPSPSLCGIPPCSSYHKSRRYPKERKGVHNVTSCLRGASAAGGPWHLDRARFARSGTGPCRPDAGSGPDYPAITDPRSDYPGCCWLCRDRHPLGATAGLFIQPWNVDQRVSDPTIPAVSPHSSWRGGIFHHGVAHLCVRHRRHLLGGRSHRTKLSCC